MVRYNYGGVVDYFFLEMKDCIIFLVVGSVGDRWFLVVLFFETCFCLRVVLVKVIFFLFGGLYFGNNGLGV